jgi:hypothetical protein
VNVLPVSNREDVHTRLCAEKGTSGSCGRTGGNSDGSVPGKVFHVTRL